MCRHGVRACEGNVGNDTEVSRRSRGETEEVARDFLSTIRSRDVPSCAAVLRRLRFRVSRTRACANPFTALLALTLHERGLAHVGAHVPGTLAR